MTMNSFVTKETIMKPTDTLANFEKKVKATKMNQKMVVTFINELNCKEGVWGIEECAGIREYLENLEG